MVIACPSCGAVSTKSARFCSHCGAKLSDGHDTSSRVQALRQVAVLFADLVDSTTLANVLDAEDLGALFGAFRTIVRDTAAQYGEPRVRFIGDGARLLFGYPKFAEDTPEEAVRCALSLRDSAQRTLFTPSREPVLMRIGVAYGTAMLSDAPIDSDLGSEAVIGAVAHLAARLAAAASPGAILVDQSLRDVAGAHFEFVATEPLRLKGFDAAVQAWQVLDETAVVSRHQARRAAVGVIAPIIGRAPELDRMRRLWRLGRSGAGRCLLLVGEPGVGKSRLATTVAEYATDDGALRLDLDCSPRTANSPLHPVRVLLRRLAGVRREDSPDRIVRLLRGWLEARIDTALAPRAIHYTLNALEPGLLPANADSESAELVRMRSIETLVDVVCLLSQGHPLLVLLEDLQWSDPTTIALLHAVLAASNRWHGMIVVTARPEARALLDRSVAESIVLEPLEPAHAESLVLGLTTKTGAAPSTEAVCWVVDRGEGIPLYLEELTRSVMDQPDALTQAVSPSTRVPTTLQNVIQVRVDRRPAHRRLMQAAATLGREFSVPMLQLLMGVDAPSVPETISRLVDDGLLVRRAGSSKTAAFRHALIHDAVYDTLLRSDRLNLHSRVADLLTAALSESPQADQALIAFHLAAAGRFRDAAASYLAAARSTNAAAAYAEAIARARAGLDALASAGNSIADQALRRALLIQLGVALTARDGYAGSEVERTYQQARQFCDNASDADEVYPILRGLATFYLVKGDLKTAYELAGEGLAQARRLGRPEHVIDALSVHGYTSLYATRLDESGDMLLECLQTYRQEGGQNFRYPVPQDAGTAAWALLPTVQWLRGLPHAAEQAVVDGLAHVEMLDRPFDRAVLHAWLAGFRFTQRRFDAARQHAQAGLAMSAKFGYTTWLGVSALMDALARAAEAPDVNAVQQAGEMLTRLAQSGSTLNAPYYLWGLAKGMARLGQSAQALAMLSQARLQAAASGEHRSDSEIDLLEVELAPSEPDATARLQSALDTARAQGDTLTALRIALTRASLWLGNAERRAAAARELAQLDHAQELPRAGDWATQRVQYWSSLTQAEGEP